MRNLQIVISLLVLFISTGCSESPLPTSNEQAQAMSISAPAELVSLQQISITPPNVTRMWEFKIEFIARENSKVKEGDLLIRFDGQRLRNDMVSRQSELDAVIKEAEQKQLENDARLKELNLDLAEALKNMNIAKRKVEITDVSRSQIERQKQQAEFEIATELHRQAIQRVEQHIVSMEINQQVQNAKISKAQSLVDELNQNINKLQVKAPKEGMVVLIPNGDDDKPAIGDTVYMGRRLISLPALDKLAVKVEFDESYTPDVSIGGRVRVTLDAFPEKPFTGEITELGQSYRSKSRNNQKMVFDAWVTLDKLDLNIMRPGMKATVELQETTI